MITTRETARRDVLSYGLIDTPHLGAMDDLVRRLHPEATSTEVQHETIEVIRSLVEDGLVESGYPGPDGDRFIIEPLAETLEQLQRSYIERFDEPGVWIRNVWVDLTTLGRTYILATEEGRRTLAHEEERLQSNRAGEVRRATRSDDGIGL